MKYILSGLIALALAGWARADSWSTYDSNGNWTTGHYDPNNGSFSGYDSNGNWYSGHYDRNSGSYSGYDSNGRWWTGHGR